jgi:hypothetical protein
MSMRSSPYLKTLLFASFSTDLRSASWSTYSSMPCEADLKSVKKKFKNHSFQIGG